MMAPESPNTPAGVQRREARQDRERIQGKNYLEKGRTCPAIHLGRLDFIGEMREPTCASSAPPPLAPTRGKCPRANGGIFISVVRSADLSWSCNDSP